MNVSDNNNSGMPMAPGGPPMTIATTDVKTPASANPIGSTLAAAAGSAVVAPVVVHANGAKLGCAGEVSALSKDEVKSFWASATIVAPAVEESKRPPADVVLVVDRSGSIGYAIELIKMAMQFIVDKQLKARDRLGIVSYADDTKEDVSLRWMDNDGKRLARESIQQLQSSGNTDIGQALTRGIDMLQQIDNPNPVQVLLLLTDGLANEGVARTTEDLVRCVTDLSFYKGPRRATNPKDRIVWEWSDQGTGSGTGTATTTWTAYDQETCDQLEEAVKTLAPVIELKHGFFANRPGYIAILDTNNYRQINIASKTSRRIRRSATTTTTSKDTPTIFNYLFNNLNSAFGSTRVAPAAASTPVASGTPVGIVGTRATVNTFGFNVGHDAKCLRSIAEAGRGTYTYISNADAIGLAFAECLGGALSVTMQNVRLQLRPQNNVKLLKVHTPFPTTTDVKTNVTTVSIPDIQAEEIRDIPVELQLPESSHNNNKFGLLDVELTFTDVVKKTEVKQSAGLSVKRLDAKDPEVVMAQVDLNVDVQRNRIVTALALLEAGKAADTDKFTLAREIIAKATTAVQASASAKAARPEVAQLIADLVSANKAITDRHAYTQGGGQTMCNLSVSHAQQRGTSYTTSNRTTACLNYSSYSSSNPSA